MSYIQANTDGVLHDARLPAISPLNRGFLYGDAIYEVWRTYGGVIFAFPDHWARLERSAGALGIALPWRPEDMLVQIRRTAAAFAAATGHHDPLYIRLQVWRGAGAIGLDPALADRPGYVLLVQPVPELTPEKLETGLSLSLATHLKRNHTATLNPAWKTGNYLNNLLCLAEARQRGADETLIVNLDGEVTEAAVSNVFFIRGREVVTPRLEAGILQGITRAWLLRGLAAEGGWTVREARLRPEELAGFEECFLSSTTRDVAPVGRVDGVCFRTGTDSATRQIKRRFAAWVEDYRGRHPHYRIAPAPQ